MSHGLTPLRIFAVAAATLATNAPGFCQTPKPPAPENARATTPRPRDAGPRVVSRAKEGTRTSPFLVPPGADRYDPEASDWRDVPPWRQTTFFGVRARGQFFVYVVDCSGSMIEEDRLSRAKAEVRRSVLDLREPQKFKVIFYNDTPLAMPGDLPRSADATSKNQLLAWLRLVEPDGGTDPRSSLRLALALQPDAVFLLSDGEFPDGTAEAVARLNTRKVPIHCVDLNSDPAGDSLRKVAADSGGRYVWRPGADGP